MTLQSSQSEDSPLEKFLKSNNPAPWNPAAVAQIFEATLEKRRIAAHGPQYTEVVNHLNPQICAEIANEFAKLSTRVIAEWSLTQPEFKNEMEGKRLSSVYHRGPHGAEMGKDAELLLAEQAKLLFKHPAQRALYIQMAKVAHAIHDVIQDKGPPNNEIASAEAYTKACNQIFDKFRDKMNNEELAQLKSVSENFGWEAIVVGTTFDFKQKRPVVDILNEASLKFQSDAPMHPDPAVACVAFACGKNDTRRMEVTLSSYQSDPDLKRLLELQFKATGGNDNIFMQFLNTRDAARDPEQVLAARHMIGQNCRMICELKTHFGKDASDLEFANFLTNLIAQASTKFDVEQHQELKNLVNNDNLDLYFDKLISSFKGDFGEIAFAKGLNPQVFDQAVADFNNLYPQHQFNLQGKGNLWKAYGVEAESFVGSIEAKLKQIHDDPALNENQKTQQIREYKMQVMCDLALYGGHQMGSALMRENKDMLREFDRVIQETQQKLSGLNLINPIPNDVQGLVSTLATLRQMRDARTDVGKENMRPPGGLMFSKGPQEDKTKAAISLCEGLLNATKEKERIEKQTFNLEHSKSRDLAPAKETLNIPTKAKL